MNSKKSKSNSSKRPAEKAPAAKPSDELRPVPPRRTKRSRRSFFEEQEGAESPYMRKA